MPLGDIALRFDAVGCFSACAHYSIYLRSAGSVLFFSRPRSEGWPHHGRTFFIYFCHCD